MSSNEERLAIIETKAENLNHQLARILSHLESEDGTVERVKKYFIDHVEGIQKEISSLEKQILLLNEEFKNINKTLDDNKWWFRSITVPVILMFIKVVYDLITK